MPEAFVPQEQYNIQQLGGDDDDDGRIFRDVK